MAARTWRGLILKPVYHFVKYCLNSINFSNLWTWGVFSFMSFKINFPNYFICFYTIINGTGLLILFLNCSLLVLRNTIDFCILILYPATLLNLLLLIVFFGCLRIFCKQNHVIWGHSFTSSFPTWVTFISFLCLNAPVRSSNIMNIRG